MRRGGVLGRGYQLDMSRWVAASRGHARAPALRRREVRECALNVACRQRRHGLLARRGGRFSVAAVRPVGGGCDPDGCGRGGFLSPWRLPVRHDDVAAAHRRRGIGDLLCRTIPAQTQALRLLTRYVGLLDDEQALATPELQRHVVTHIRDLARWRLAPTATPSRSPMAAEGVRRGCVRSKRTSSAASLAACSVG